MKTIREDINLIEAFFGKPKATPAPMWTIVPARDEAGRKDRLFQIIKQGNYKSAEEFADDNNPYAPWSTTDPEHIKSRAEAEDRYFDSVLEFV